MTDSKQEKAARMAEALRRANEMSERLRGEGPDLVDYYAARCQKPAPEWFRPIVSIEKPKPPAIPGTEKVAAMDADQRKAEKALHQGHRLAIQQWLAGKRPPAETLPFCENPNSLIDYVKTSVGQITPEIESVLQAFEEKTAEYRKQLEAYEIEERWQREIQWPLAWAINMVKARNRLRQASRPKDSR